MKKIPSQKILDWVARNFHYKPRANGTELLIANPFYGNDKRKFSISTTKGVCHDWRGDEWSGLVNKQTGKRNCSFIHFVQLYRKCSFTEALKEILGTGDLKAFLRPEVESEKPKPKVVRVALPAGVKPLSGATDKQAIGLCKWLKSRGYTDETIAKHDLHFLGMEVYWPYYEFSELVYWQSRSRLNKKFRFPNTSIIDDAGNVVAVTEGSRGDYLFGIDEVTAASYLIVTESIFCVTSLGEQTMASGGASLSPSQLRKIKMLGPRRGIILSPDNDKAGIQSILANHRALSSYGWPMFYSLPPPMANPDWNDWNDLFQHEHKSLAEIRALHDSRVRSLHATELLKLRLMLKHYSA